MKRALSSPRLSRPVTLKRTRIHRDRCRQRQKNQRTLRPSHVAILCTDGITQSLLQFLEAEAIEAVVMTIKASLESSGNTHGVLWDEAFWSSLLKLHCGDLAPVWRDSEKLRVQLPTVVRSRESGACEALLQFVAWAHEREWLDHHVEIIMGDASRMDPVSGAEHGEVVIGSTFYKTGLLSIMGDDLEWSQSSEFQPELSVHAFHRGNQNAFTVFRRNTRARSLIHFIDPSAAMTAPWEALCRSFGAAVDIIEREDLRNVAMVTQSRCTGASLTTAALTGLREIQRCLMTRTWNGTVGVVCYNKESFQTFKAQKEKILKCFGDFR
uniref:Uncharacterized protein n=1 Tax=Globisporangium ultimum (strain ATCC 200006 / CBS 805.95 / DAOM BR144) TaxID=431595 RepID=K3W9D6_GLOUD